LVGRQAVIFSPPDFASDEPALFSQKFERTTPTFLILAEQLRRRGGYPLIVKASSIDSFTCSTPAMSRDVSAWASPLAVVRTKVAVRIGKAELKRIVITNIMPPAIPTWIQLAHSK
jgi:hypothetical protein